MNLLRAELSRWLARRGLWITLVAGIVLAALASTVLVSSTRPPSAEEIAESRAVYQQVHAEWEANHEQAYQDCLEQAKEDAQTHCKELWPEPQENDYLRFSVPFPDAMQQAATTGTILGSLIALVMAATFWGAEYRHGTVATWLTFVPDRTTVWASRMAVAVLAGTAVTAIVVAVPMTAVAVGVVIMHGAETAAVPTPQAWMMAGRGLGLGAIFALLGGSLAVLFRQTMAPILMPVAYLFVQLFTGFLVFQAGLGWLVPYLPETNIRAYLDYGTTYAVAVPTLKAEGMVTEYVERVLPFGQGLAYLLGIAGVVAVAAWLAFRRRDVA